MFLRWGRNICCEVTGLQRDSSDLPQEDLEIPCNLVFEGILKEVEKIEKIVTLVESDPPTRAVDANENITQCSNVNLEITKSPSAAISVSEPSSTVVRI